MRLNVSCTLLVSEQCGGRSGAGGESLPPFFVGTPGNRAGEAALWYSHRLAAAAVPAALGRSILWE